MGGFKAQPFRKLLGFSRDQTPVVRELQDRIVELERLVAGMKTQGASIARAQSSTQAQVADIAGGTGPIVSGGDPMTVYANNGSGPAWYDHLLFAEPAMGFPADPTVPDGWAGSWSLSEAAGFSAGQSTDGATWQSTHFSPSGFVLEMTDTDKYTLLAQTGTAASFQMHSAADEGMDLYLTDTLKILQIGDVVTGSPTKYAAIGTTDETASVGVQFDADTSAALGVFGISGTTGALAQVQARYGGDRISVSFGVMPTGGALLIYQNQENGTVLGLSPDLSDTGVTHTLVLPGKDGTLATLDDITGGGGVASVVPGSGIAVDDTDPANPIVSVTGGGATVVAEYIDGDITRRITLNAETNTILSEYIDAADSGNDSSTVLTFDTTAGTWSLGVPAETDTLATQGWANTNFMPIDSYVFGTGGDTASRPDPTTVIAGFQYYDTDLGYPIWSNGTTWADATNTPV